MLGLIIGTCYFVYLAFMNGGAASPEAALLQATSFLYIWYWITCSISVAIVAVLMILPVLGSGAVGATGGEAVGGALGMVVGGIGGLAAGGFTAALGMVRILIRCALLIVGTYLVMTSGTADMDFTQFDMWRLIGGAAMVLIPLIFLRSRSSSSD